MATDVSVEWRMNFMEEGVLVSTLKPGVRTGMFEDMGGDGDWRRLRGGLLRAIHGRRIENERAFGNKRTVLAEGDLEEEGGEDCKRGEKKSGGGRRGFIVNTF